MNDKTSKKSKNKAVRVDYLINTPCPLCKSVGKYVIDESKIGDLKENES